MKLYDLIPASEVLAGDTMLDYDLQPRFIVRNVRQVSAREWEFTFTDDTTTTHDDTDFFTVTRIDPARG